MLAVSVRLAVMLLWPSSLVSSCGGFCELSQLAVSVSVGALLSCPVSRGPPLCRRPVIRDPRPSPLPVRRSTYKEALSPRLARRNINITNNNLRA